MIKPSSPYCVMQYFWWGWRGNLTLITLRSERVKTCMPVFWKINYSMVIICFISLEVGSHEGTCCRDMLRGRISCAVHTKGHVAGIGFLKCSHGGSCRRDML